MHYFIENKRLCNGVTIYSCLFIFFWMPIVVIVESGAKGPKIEKILGKGYHVRGCYGRLASEHDVPTRYTWMAH